MNKKFKRLISVILTVMMAIGMMPFSGLTTVSAASSGAANSTFYLDASKMMNNKYWDDEVDTIKAHLWYNGNGNANKASASIIMTAVSGKDHWYSVTLPDKCWKIKVQRGSYNTAELRFDSRSSDAVNVLKISSWNSAYWNGVYSGGGGGTTTGTFNVDADLVDYLNDSRVGLADGYTGSNPNVYWNQGNATGPSNQPYSKLNQWLSNLAGYAHNGVNSASSSNAPVPLYFGDLLHANQAGGDLTWYWKGANVAFGPNDNTANKDVAQGIVGSHLVNGDLVTSYTDASGNAVKVPFFNEGAYDNQSDYMHFYNNLQFPFQSTTTNGVTKYSFNSKQNNVYYDYASKQIKSSTTQIKDVQGESGYFPFNSSNVSDNLWKLNYGFGTKFTIPFAINTDGKDANGGDVTFNFTGDDDVWVYIDGALVLDMGGAHELAKGSINFATQKVKITTGTSNAKIGNQSTAGGRAAAVNNGKSTVDFSSITVKLADESTTTLAEHMKKDGEVHTLVMYYMERGMWNSNMSIDFSFVPLPSGLTLSKDVNVEQVNTGLQDVARTMDTFEFNIADSNNADKAKEYSYVLDYNGSGVSDSINTTSQVVTGVSDSAFAKDFEYASGDDTGLKLGTNFTITEAVDSDKYSTRWFVTDLKAADITKPVAQGETTAAKFTLGKADPDNPFATASYNVNFINTMKVGTLTLKKEYTGTPPTGDAFEFTVLVDLNGGTNYSAYPLVYKSDKDSGGTTSQDGKLSIQAGETVTFEGIPAGATYQITETAPAAGAIWVKDTETGTTGTITAGATASAVVTNKTNEITLNKVIYVEADTATPFTVKDGEDVVKVTDTTAPTGITASVDANGVPSFTASEANKKYEVSYTGSKTNSTSVKGTITVYSYKATDDVYVFDYGLKSDLADTTHGVGMFQNDVLFNSNVTTTNAEFSALTTNGLTQSTITANATLPLNLAQYNSTSGAQLTDSESVTFEPTAFMDKKETASYETTVLADGRTAVNSPEDGVKMNANVTVMPASVVYYEDNFASITTDDNTGKIIDTRADDYEAPLQSNDQTENYGHDDAYTGVTDSAGGSTQMIADDVNTEASFTFTGTGFDIVGRSNTTSAGIGYRILKDGTAIKVSAVDTYYANGDLYQIPVIHEDVEYGTYTVEFFIYGKDTTFYLDGIRIYNPMKNGDDAYIADEKGATFTKVSKLILGDGVITETGTVDGITGQTITGSTAALLDYSDIDNKLSALGYTKTEDTTEESSNQTQSILQYLHSGPNNEIYLDNTAAIAFVATKTGSSDDRTIQIEAKLVNMDGMAGDAPSSNGVDLNVWNSSGLKQIDTVDTTTAKYYAINLNDCYKIDDNNYLVVILGNTDENTHCLSFSNLKVNGYDISNPISNASLSSVIDTSALTGDSKFVSFDGNYNNRKNQWVTNKYSITMTENVFGDEAPKFEMVYINNGKEAPITVSVTKTTELDGGQYKYTLKFKTPNAVGNFPIQIRYINSDGTSSEYLATTLQVKK